jgi:Na(+)-translocating NADH:ubiquinone oxidoreductase A subunit
VVFAGVGGKVAIPLKQGCGEEVAPLVEVGDEVRAGRIIGRSDDSVSSPVHSSVNGKVVGIETIDYPDGQRTVVVIESDGTDDWQTLEGYSAKWEGLSQEDLERLIYLSGASAAGRCGIPTRFRSSVTGPDDVEDVIVCGLEAEVYNCSADDLLKDERITAFAEGVKILRKVMAGARVHVVLDNSRTATIAEVSRLLAGTDGVKVCGMESRYPAHYDEVLVPTVLDREFPYGYSAANIGVIVVDVEAVIRVYEAVAKGKAVIESTVALCGEGFSENVYVKARIGTPLEAVIDGRKKPDKAIRFVRNSCLTGETIGDLSAPMCRELRMLVGLVEGNEREFMSFLRPGVNRDSFSKVFLSAVFKGKDSKNCNTNLHGEGRPCIFCGYCQDACPTGLIPHLLFHYVEKGLTDERLVNFRIFNCIECNLCSYVCVSKIALAGHIRDGKKKLAEEGLKSPTPTAFLKGIEQEAATGR